MDASERVTPYADRGHITRRQWNGIIADTTTEVWLYGMAEYGYATSLDVHELDAASNNGVEAMRDLVSRAALGTPGRQKVYIVDEVHMLSTAASNALLKTLEEPPAHVVFVLATTDPQKVLPTIRSRTQHFEFRLLGPETLGELLDQVRREAHLEVPDEALDLAVRRGRGSARDALSILDQVAASDSVDDDLPELDEVVEALAERDIGRALVAVAHLTSAGFSPQQLTTDLVDHLRQGFLAMVAPELMAVSGAEREALSSRAERVGLAALVRAMEVLGRAQVDMRDAPDPRVNLEVALVRLAHPEADESPEALLARIERLEAVARASGSPAPAPLAAAARPAAPPAAPAAGRAPSRSATAPARPAIESSVAPDPSNPESEPVSPLTKPTLGALRRGSAPPAARQPVEVVADEPVAPTPPSEPPPVGGPPAGPATAPTDAAAPAVPSSGGPTQPFPTRDQLVQAWGDHVIGRLRPKAKALFQAGRFVGVDGERAVFGLPNETHRNRCEDVRSEIEVALSEQFGRPVGLDLVVDPGAEPVGARPSLPADDPGPAAGAVVPTPAPPAPAAPPVDYSDAEDPSVFDESELGEVAQVDNSAEARVLQAFPGAEEVG